MANITNLEGTTWKIKADPDVSEAFEYDILFKANGAYFDVFKAYETIADQTDMLDYSAGGVHAYMIEDGATSGDWVKTAYQYIEITGGSDVEDEDLIEWLYANATLIQFKNFYSVDVDCKGRVIETGVKLKRHDTGLNCFYVTVTDVENLAAFCDEIKAVYRDDGLFTTKEYVCPLYYTDDTDLVSNKVICDVPDEVIKHRGHWTGEIHLFKGSARKATARFGFTVQPDISEPKCREARI